VPSTAVFLTQAEYDGIMQRLAGLEAALPGRSSEVEALTLRVQSLESTLSAFSKTVAELPSSTKGVISDATKS